MNRFKKELRKKGVKLECDYPYMPYRVGQNIYMEDVYVNSEKATVTEFLNVIDNCWRMTREGELIDWNIENRKRKGW